MALMRIKPNGIPIPRPIPKALGLDEFEEGVVVDVNRALEAVSVVAVGVEAVVEDVDAVKDVELYTGFLRIISTST
jgi:hypothetical protein